MHDDAALSDYLIISISAAGDHDSCYGDDDA